MSLPRHRLFLVSMLFLAGGVEAQIRGLKSSKGGASGIRVEMFESASLDRFIRSATASLDKGDFEHAIKVLQEVIEGRTGEFMAEDAEDQDPADSDEKPKQLKSPGRASSKPGTSKPGTSKARDALPIDEENPAYSVFSSDDRIYRPVSRLCHELLAGMPPEGMGLYRVKYEALAEQAFHAAEKQRDLAGLEAVYSHYFVTLSSGRAMLSAIGMLMDAGRFRAAIQTLENLLEIYPADNRKEAGISDLMLMVKLAVCYQQLGEMTLARDQVQAAAEAFPEASVRLMGELYTVRDMHASELFDDSSQVETVVRSRGQALDLLAAKALTPMWEYRFTEMTPYRSVKSRKTRSSRAIRFNNAGTTRGHGTRFPKHRKYSPGISVQFDGSKVLFLDNFRPLVHDLVSGRQTMAMGDSGLAKYRVPTNSSVPRSRSPIYDYFGNRVALDAERYYVLEGYNRSATTASFKSLHSNRLVAYHRETGAEAWNKPGTWSGKRDVQKRAITFLATPTVYRRRLLVPFLDAGIYGVLCLSSVDRSEIFRTYLHSGGTDFARAPSPQVVVEAGIAYVMTNAGVLGAVDANTGVLNWSRKYERVHPKRGRRRAKVKSRYNNPFSNYAIAQVSDFSGFVPSNLHLAGDLILLAPADGNVLLCLNAANGEILWMHNAEYSIAHSVLDAKLSYLVGHNDDYLFVLCGESQLMCVGLRSGLRYWIVKMPGLNRDDWRGRGCVTADYVIMPGRAGSRQVHVIPANTNRQPACSTLDLPSFSVGKEPLAGPTNLQVQDAYLAVCYEGGIELYSSPGALEHLSGAASTTDQRAVYLVHAGKLEAAIRILFATLDRQDLVAKARRRASIRVLSLVQEVAALLATNGKREAALKVLDQCESRLRDPRLVLRVHLFRLQVFRVLGDLAGVEREQEFIENGGVK